ncbi:hypothetical protein QUA79_21845 [Microcoleus sp. F8-D1]|uniref:hypothetical protein n=1 Tax=Phormidium nigroviride TaxID=482564 RepID=UPI0026857DFC
MMIDSQAVKNTCNASIASKGYCFYKSTNGYHPEHLITELKKIYPQILTKIKFELSEKPSKQQKKKPKVNQDLFQLKRDGESNDRMLGLLVQNPHS